MKGTVNFIMKMKNLNRILWLAGITIPAALSGDTLQLADGGLLEGEFIGGSNKIIMFKSGSDIEAYPHDDVVAIFLSAGMETVEASASSSQSATIVVPVGTRLMILMSDSIDTSQHPVDH